MKTRLFEHQTLKRCSCFLRHRASPVEDPLQQTSCERRTGQFLVNVVTEHLPRIGDHAAAVAALLFVFVRLFLLLQLLLELLDARVKLHQLPDQGLVLGTQLHLDTEENIYSVRDTVKCLFHVKDFWDRDSQSDSLIGAKTKTF